MKDASAFFHYLLLLDTYYHEIHILEPSITALYVQWTYYFNFYFYIDWMRKRYQLLNVDVRLKLFDRLAEAFNKIKHFIT